MILILSSEVDISTTEVQFWMRCFDMDFLRISDEDGILLKCLELSNEDNNALILVVSNGNEKFELYLNEINGYWYRRGEFTLISEPFHSTEDINRITISKLNKIQLDENSRILDYMNFKLLTGQSINSFNDNYLNKLNLLSIAKDFGLLIPPTIVTTQKDVLSEFFTKHREIITKSLWNGINFELGDLSYSLPTMLFDFLGLNENIPNSFAATLFQKNIQKRYELRIFYLDGVFYSSCIFSQRDPQTKIDFRIYNHENPNRVVPYNLPESVKRKLHRLMEYLMLKSGSIDMICSLDGQYYFLEINPIGQFKQVSMPCNYYLEREIAMYYEKKSSK